jgi:hypothetical protein
MTAPRKATVGRILAGTTTYAAKSLSLEPEVSLAASNHSGQQMPSGQRVAGAAPPRLRFTMYADDAIAAFGLTFANITTLKAYFGLTSGGVFTAGATHTEVSKEASAIVSAWIDSWSVDEGGEWMATVIAVFYSADGSTDPVAIDEAVAMPALTAQPALHGIGLLTINGTARPGMIGCNYQAGLSLVYQRTDGLPYPTGGIISGFNPGLTIPHADPIGLAVLLGSDGVAIASTTKVELYRYLAAGGALSATGKKTITIATGYVRPSAGGGNHGDLAKGGCEISGTSSNGATHPFAVT